MRARIPIALLCALATATCLSSCSTASPDGSAAARSIAGELVFEEEHSPNEAYVDNPEDVVYDHIQVHQDPSSHEITVDTSSNSAFFEPVTYTVACDAAITADDVAVTWTTLMGNPEPTEDDQLVIAHIAISADGEILDERTVNFMSGATELIFS